MDRFRRRRGDGGETLVELIVAIAILGIAGVAILAGVMLSVKSSDMHSKQARGGAYVRSFAEAIQTSIDISGGYKPCSTAPAAYRGVPVPDLPPGYSTDVTAIQSWSGSGWGACSSTGIQRVDLVVRSGDADPTRRAEETLTVVLRRPCNGNAVSSTSDPCSP